MTLEEFEKYVNEILDKGHKPMVTQGQSMQPTIAPAHLISTAPLTIEEKYNGLIKGEIYCFKENEVAIIKRLNNVIGAGDYEIYEFLGDNRSDSLDKVFKREKSQRDENFRRIVLYPNVPVPEHIIDQIRGGN